MRTVPLATLTACLLLISLLLVPVAHAETVDDTVRITFEPEELHLDPGEEDEVTFRVTNLLGEPLKVSFEFVPQDVKGQPDGFFSVTFRVLAAGETVDSDLKVKSNAPFVGRTNETDFHVLVHWGRELEVGEGGRPLPGTAEGQWRVAFKDVDQPADDVGLWPVAVVVAGVVVVTIALLWPGIRGKAEGRMGTEEPPGIGEPGT